MKNFLLSLSESLNNKTIRILCGFFIIVFCLILTNSLAVLLVSIICTLGIAIPFWLAIAYIVGTIISLTINLLVSSKRRELSLDEKSALEKYIREAKDQQLSRMEVKKKLIDVGWSEQLVVNIVNSVYGQESEPEQKLEKE